MTTLLVRGGEVVADGERLPADLTIDDDRITSIGVVAAAPSEAVLDASGCSVLPGFVDLQVNGAVGVDLTTQPHHIERVAAFLPQTGVTAFMPTVISSPIDDIAAAVAVMHQWAVTARRQVPAGARSLGVHIEGPFLNPIRRGAHLERHLRQPSLDAITGWTREAGVAMVTLAPELERATEAIAELVRRGIVVCAGHTAADPAVIDLAAQAGIAGVTHLFNAMGVMSARAPGPATATLTHPTLIAGLIVDGTHVDPAMVRLAWRMLGPDRVALVSDAMAALGLPNGTYAIGDAPVVVDATGVRTVDGVLAGSVLRMDDAVRSLMSFTGCDLVQAAQAASGTPARLARESDIGRLAAGCIADLVLLDGACRVVATVVGGRVVWDPQARTTTTSTTSTTNATTTTGRSSWKS